MRIIGGKRKNLRIHAPKGLPVRPTTDLTKESIFNILTNYIDIDGLEVLDLFSGTGNMSYEFASRDCNEVIAVEQNYRAVKFIRDTSRKMEFENMKVIKADVFSFLKSTPYTYDVIFADPPYILKNIPDIHKLVFENKLLNPDGWLIIEHPKEVEMSSLEGFDNQRKYGRTILSIFRNKTV